MCLGLEPVKRTRKPRATFDKKRDSDSDMRLFEFISVFHKSIFHIIAEKF